MSSNSRGRKAMNEDDNQIACHHYLCRIAPTEMRGDTTETDLADIVESILNVSIAAEESPKADFSVRQFGFCQ